jgi:hypothetical protein
MVTVVCLANVQGDEKQLQEQLWVLETCAHADAGAIVDNVKNDLLSGDALLQDAGCIILLKMLDRGTKAGGNPEVIFDRLSRDDKVVGIAADIIDSRMLGWYNPEASEEIDDDIRIYVPLFQILGKSGGKTARATLARSFLYLRGHPDILKMIPMNEEMVVYSVKRLREIESKLCCMYPGREAVVDMLEKDSRYGLLDMFENYLASNKSPGEKIKKEMKEFAVDCMRYGDAKNGYIVRIKAARLAGMLLKAGETDLRGTIREISQSDPFYVHAFDSRTGFSLKELNYPVREACSKILLLK